VIEKLIPAERAVLKPGGYLVFEISGTIVDGVRRLMDGWDEMKIAPDLQGIPRIVSARKPSGKNSL